ncbi:MAG TPA: UDP-glucose 4-epimerase GalE, partial [Alphaproteobacteria bacterium]|nr:UDP-glucose 4-epimerase GalE [Alphaproteobacteria bacterium]
MKKILVTGGAGYIGSHTCKLLKQEGYEPVTFDNLCNGHEHAVKWGPFIYGDLRDVDAVEAVFRTHEFSAVIHFASLIEVGESIKNPEKYYDNNVLGAMNLLKVMHANDVSRIVFSSSCAVYGTPDQVPIDEDTAMEPINPYGQTKMMIEQMLQADTQAYGLKYVACRYFNACGADPDLEIGEEHNPETHIIPLALAAAAGDRAGFNIYGD